MAGGSIPPEKGSLGRLCQRSHSRGRGSPEEPVAHRDARKIHLGGGRGARGAGGKGAGGRSPSPAGVRRAKGMEPKEWGFY